MVSKQDKNLGEQSIKFCSCMLWQDVNSKGLENMYDNVVQDHLG